MSSIHLPSFFHNRSNSKKEAPSLLSKRSTLSFRIQQEEEHPPSLRRSNTTISKVKRFGSLLSRNKKSDDNCSIRRVDKIFPPSIDTTLSTSNYSLSAISTKTNVSSDEEDLITPINSNLPPNNVLFKNETELTIEEAEAIEIKSSKSVTPQDQTNHMSTDISVAEKFDFAGEEQIDSIALSSLVQFYLSTAIDEADIEIEDELQVCRDHMLHSIRVTPAYSF